MKLIVGLGNPGPEYENTRHNLGFMALDALVDGLRLGCANPEKQANAWTCRASVRGTRVLLAKPRTFMNRSGLSVKGLMGIHGLDAGDVIVVHDDLDLPLGAIKIKKDGGDGGHNGIASVIEELGTRSFVRVRLGIGRPPRQIDPAEYVLSPFLMEERELASETLKTAAEALTVIIRDGVGRAMTLFNRRGPAGAGTDAGEGGE